MEFRRTKKQTTMWCSSDLALSCCSTCNQPCICSKAIFVPFPLRLLSGLSRQTQEQLQHLRIYNEVNRACPNPAVRNNLQFGVPSPVTGSQPLAVEKPEEPQFGLLPFTMSFKTSGCAYLDPQHQSRTLKGWIASLSLTMSG